MGPSSPAAGLGDGKRTTVRLPCGDGAKAGSHGGGASALQPTPRLVKDLTGVLQVHTLYGNAGRHQPGAWGAGPAGDAWCGPRQRRRHRSLDSGGGLGQRGRRGLTLPPRKPRPLNF